ncbi:hypothetical protein [Spirosoma radiotolerans]
MLYEVKDGLISMEQFFY